MARARVAKMLLTNILPIFNFMFVVQTRAVVAGTCTPAWGLPSIRSLVMQQPDECEPRRYRGGMYGVTAMVTVDLQKQKAHVQLWGLPIGGRVEGSGWLASNQAAGAVELEEEFAAALARRFVSIGNARLDRAADTLTVVASLPLLGEQTLVLQRETGPV
tara:strand:- start:993 stop:1472 length:480 start_codon:yes stop_codon:yes gene_type:complete